ncbi:MAG: TrkA family potassium uptake protein [Acidimicrobiia bacterium]
MDAIVVGAGSIPRALLRRLGARWHIVVIDTDGDRLALAARDRAITPVLGDGSSAVVLRRSGIESADAVVAASGDDDINLEVCRSAQMAGVERILAVVNDPSRLAEYRMPDVVTVSPSERTARSIEVHLEPRRVSSVSFADGLAEAIELQIAPDASVRGTALRDTHSDTWIVAAVLRDGALIVPHGDTRFEAGDRVTVVGHARSVESIIRTFTAGESRFPKNYGLRVAVVLEDEADLAAVLEAADMARLSQAEGLIVLHPKSGATGRPDGSENLTALVESIEDQTRDIEIQMRAVSGSLDDALRRLIAEESIGTVCVPAPGGHALARRAMVVRLIRKYHAAGVALLVSRGSHPYRSVAVPARTTPSGERAARCGIDLANDAEIPVVGVFVMSPTFVGRVDELRDARRAAVWLREEAAVQGVQTNRHVRRGNPVRILAGIGEESGLLVMALPDSKVSLLRPGLAAYVTAATGASVVLVPQLPPS